MSNLTIQINDYVSPFAKYLPKVASIGDLIYVEKHETDAFGHWIFADNSTSLVDKVNNRNLTLQSGATVQPIYTTNSVQLSAKAGNALLSGLSDTATQDVTVALVVKCNQTTLSILGGNLPFSASTTENGFSPFASANKVYQGLKPTKVAETGGFNSVTNNQSLTQTDYMFVVMSVNKSEKSGILYTQQNGVEADIESLYRAAYENSSNIAIANSAYSKITSGSLVYAEAIIYNKALTLTEIKALAKRSKKRLEYRGVTF